MKLPPAWDEIVAPRYVAVFAAMCILALVGTGDAQGAGSVLADIKIAFSIHADTGQPVEPWTADLPTDRAGNHATRCAEAVMKDRRRVERREELYILVGSVIGDQQHSRPWIGCDGGGSGHGDLLRLGLAVERIALDDAVTLKNPRRPAGP